MITAEYSDMKRSKCLTLANRPNADLFITTLLTIINDAILKLKSNHCLILILIN